jgi:integrase
VSTQPTRRRIEPGIYERLGADGERLGLEVVYKDADGKTRRRTVHGGLDDARDQLAKARVRRTDREREPDNPRLTFDAVVERFREVHLPGLRPNTVDFHEQSLARLLKALGGKRITAVDKTDLRKLIADERKEGLKASTINAHLRTLRVVYGFAADDLGIPVTMPRLKRGERPRDADDAREHRILTDTELGRVLAACDARTRLYFRAVADTGMRKSEGLSVTRRRVGADIAMLTVAEQLDEDGALAPIKNSRRRTIEITRSLADALADEPERTFGHLTHAIVDHAWQKARKASGIPGPLPTIHDLRHTHVSALIADGWDAVEIANRIGDTLETTLRVYAHEFDAARRSKDRRRRLEDREAARMATSKPQQTATERPGAPAEVADLQAVRRRAS